MFPSGIDPIYQVGDVVGTGGPWYNHAGKRGECDSIDWDAPDGRRIRVGLVIPCPLCGYPFIVARLDPGVHRLGEDGQLSFAPVLRCPAYWRVVDESGAPTGETRRCGWVGVIRHGLAHHPQCPAVHLPQCGHPNGRPCSCGMSGDERRADNCRCGAVGGR